MEREPALDPSGILPECPMCQGFLPLFLAREGEWVQVAALSGGRGFQDRLAGLGIRVGAVIQVLCNTQGKLLVRLGSARLFLGGGMAQRIQVVYRERRSA